MALSIDDARTFLPAYLNPSSREALFSELSRIPQTNSYYSKEGEIGFLQGDGWANVRFVNVDTFEARPIRVVVISNTCDVDRENPRDLPIKVMISPLIKLSSVIGVLAQEGIPDRTINAKVDAIRAQEVSNIFFLPKNPLDNTEYCIFLDNIQSVDSGSFFGDDSKSKIFSLNQIGFWYFLLKLSIHFCRANEGVTRGM